MSYLEIPAILDQKQTEQIIPTWRMTAGTGLSQGPLTTNHTISTATTHCATKGTCSNTSTVKPAAAEVLVTANLGILAWLGHDWATILSGLNLAVQG
jgi:hypothetical protein